jgi:DNA repair exonuclease SbcCD ATPase subunit
MAAEPPDDLVDELYGAPLDEFIAQRDARAKELRKGDRATADAVKKLRKPSVAAAAVNRLAREAPEDVDALMGAGEALRQAQFGGGDRDAIRDAAREERDAVERLVGRAGKLSSSVLEEVRETLRAAATDEEARELIRRGVLTESRRPTGLGGFGVAPGAAPAAPPPAKRGGKTRKAKPDSRDREAEAEAEAARERQAEAERKRQAKERAKAARAALREAEKAATAAERERDRATKQLDKAERAAAKAREEAERLRGELEAAETAG